MTDSMDTVDTSRHRIEQLNPNDYSLWSKKLELIVRGKGVWGTVFGEKSPPDDGMPEELRNFQRRKDTTLSNVLLSIEDASSAAVIYLRDPSVVRNEFKKAYRAVSEAAIDSLLIQYRARKKMPEESVSQYVNRSIQLENKLTAIGKTIGKDKKTGALLRGLTFDFKVIAQVVRAMKKDSNKAIEMLLTHETSLQENHALSEEPEPFAAFSTTQDKVKRRSHGERRGHVKLDCFPNPRSTKCRPTMNIHWANRSQSEPQNDNNSVTEPGSGYVTYFAKCLTSPMQVSEIRNKWFIDSGATWHLFNSTTLFSKLSEEDKILTVSVGNESQANMAGVGTIRCIAKFDDTEQKTQLNRTLYIPDLMRNLLSVSCIRRAGFRVVFENDLGGKGICLITEAKVPQVVLKGGEREDGMYVVDFILCEKISMTNVALSLEEKQNLWHARLGQVSKNVIQQTASMVDEVDVRAVNIEKCESYIKRKSKRHTCSSLLEDQSSRPLELVNSDIIGPVSIHALGGSRYCVSLYDDFSGLSIIRFLKAKDEAAEALIDIIWELESASQSNYRQMVVTRLQTDNAKEFLSSDFTAWLRRKGLTQELSSSYSPNPTGKQNA